jgi:hypothetical protein
MKKPLLKPSSLAAWVFLWGTVKDIRSSKKPGPMSKLGENHEIEIFAVGDHTSSNGASLAFSYSDLDAIASSYNPEIFDAPAVVGHPRDNSPAYGWVESVKRVGEKLVAKLTQIDPDFEEAVREGRYKKISASFYSPDSPANPNPGNYYLRHVGFLGGMAPAVKGLKSVAFSEEEGVLDFCGYDNQFLRNLREWLISAYDLETANQVIPSYLITEFRTVSEEAIDYLEGRIRVLEEQISEFMSPDIQEKLEEIGRRAIQAFQYMEEIYEVSDSVDYSEKEAELEKREKALVEKESALKRARVMDFVANRISEGRLLPSEKTEIIEFMCALPDETIDFSEEKSAAPLDWFQGWLKLRPAVINYGEVATEGKNITNLDPKAIAEQARKLVDERKSKGSIISYSEAVHEVMGGK